MNFINKGITVEQILKQLFLAASTALFSKWLFWLLKEEEKQTKKTDQPHIDKKCETKILFCFSFNKRSSKKWQQEN